MFSDDVVGKEVEKKKSTKKSNYQSKKKSTNVNISKYKTPLIVIVLVVLFIIIYFALRTDNSFNGIEKRLVSKAEEYVNENNITTSKEIYLDSTKIEVDLPEKCNLLSGVIYNGTDYKPYLLCSDYESELMPDNDKYRLIGSDVIILLKGMKYSELGYKSSDKVNINGEVLDEEGVYNLYYSLENSSKSVIRKVIVVNNSSLTNYFPKIINVNSENDIINKGVKYEDSVIAVDSSDGNITNRIIKSSNVNEFEAGEYKIVYSVRNDLGYNTLFEKKVTVVEPKSTEEVNVVTKLSNQNMTNEDVVIKVSIVGDNYKHTILPDKTKAEAKEFEYKVSENGKYEFIIVDSSDNEISKIVSITNIDKTVPTGTCEATLLSQRTEVKVNVTSFNYIEGYSYSINGKETAYLPNKNYTVSTKATSKEVYVKIKDYIGNEAKIDCNVTDKRSSLDDNGIRSGFYNSVKSRLRIPLTQALANRGHTVNDVNKCIRDAVIAAGPYTRYGVAAAAYGVIDCIYTMTGYVISYDHTGGKVGGNYCSEKVNASICGKLGVNVNWGKQGGTCNSDQCYYGMNCATAVRWAMCNGGMDLCSRGDAGAHSMVNVKYFPEADGVYVQGNKVEHYCGNHLESYGASALVRMLKPGDAIASGEGGGHAFLVIGRDSGGIYTAEDGYFTRYISYSEMTNGKIRYRLLFLDRYYANPANRNNLYG